MSLDVIKTTRGAAPAKLDFAMLVSYTLPHESRKANTHDNDKNAAGEWVKIAPPKGTPGQVDQGAPSSGGGGARLGRECTRGMRRVTNDSP